MKFKFWNFLRLIKGLPKIYNIEKLKDEVLIKHNLNGIRADIARSNQFNIYTAMNVAIIAKEMEANGYSFSSSGFSSEDALKQTKKFMEFNDNFLTKTEKQQKETSDLLEELKCLLEEKK